MTVETLAERYPDNESIADEQWIREVTDDGLVILLKDARVRKKPAERLAILESGARAFVITNAQLTGDAMSELILENRGRMEQALRRPGPFIYALYRGRIEQLELERRDV